MKKYRFLALLLLLPMVAGLFAPPAAALDDPTVYCNNAVLYDANYGEVLYDLDAYERAYPASTTKVMTALLVVEAIEAGLLAPDTPVTAGAERMEGIPSGKGYVVADLKEGETLPVEELLYCVLLPSHADAANVLAVAVDSSVEAFVDHMNRKASELGCQDTHFTNPVGVHSEEPGLFVTADHRAQGRIVAAHLITRHAERVAIVGHAANQTLRLRLEGARDAFAARPDIALEVLDAGEGDVSGDGYSLGQQIARRRAEERPDALLALTDELGAGAIAGIMAAGLTVPDDLMVAGCGGNPLAWGGAVPLTTSAPTGYEVGRKAVQLVVEAIELKRAEERASIRQVRTTMPRSAAPLPRASLAEEHEPLTHHELVRPFLLARESTGGTGTVTPLGTQTALIPELNLGVYL